MYPECRIIFCVAALSVASQLAADTTRDTPVQNRSFAAPTIGLTPAGLARITLAGCEPDIQTGRPVLPVSSATFILPAGQQVANVSVTPGDVIEIPLPAPVEWGQPPRQPEDPPIPEAPADPAVYGSAVPYPDPTRPVWRLDPQGTDSSRLSVQLFPVRFDPARRLLLSASTLTVSVTLQPQAPTTATKNALLATSPLALTETHTYVILSTFNLLVNTPAPWNFQTLCAVRANAGFTPAMVSTEWVDANYPGTNTSARIRAFVQDAHRHWGTRYLLIGGTYALIPAQKLYVSFTDLLPRTTEIPADAIYYGCLDGPFDNNGNGRFGEPTDGSNGGDVDLVAEVMVGRFPVADASELANMVRKTLQYETAPAQKLAPSAFMAEKMDLGTLIYADGFMEELRLGSTTYGLNSLGFECAAYTDAFDTSPRLYDSDASLWSSEDSLAFLNRNFSSVNHIGHAGVKQCMKIDLLNTSHLAALRAFTNTLPYFAYSQSCSAGAFDTADCFAEQLVTVSNAACAAVMNAREGWVYLNTVGGYSHRFHRCFWDAALRGTATRLGEINEQSRLMCLYLINPTTANYWRWVYYELNLFGDPATPFVPALNLVPPAITHEPLINTYDTQTSHRVACTLEPVGIFAPETVALTWQSSRETEIVHTQSLSQTFGNLFETEIPPQPANTRISYTIHAANRAGVTTTTPASEAAEFSVTERINLTIDGSPEALGTVTPDYGTHDFASGLVATASAPALYPVGPDTRYANQGFFGSGSAPQSGTNLTVSFQINRHSYLFWIWQREYLQTVRSDLAAFPTQTFWTAENDLAYPDPAPAVLTDASTVYAFAEWHLDGTRAPPAPAHSPPTFGAVTSDAPHTLSARYLPIDLDADANGIPDWWEFQYYGANGQDPYADEDGDGYALWEEYSDRTSPFDPTSYPAPPQIVHTPLNAVQTRPGPFTIRAAISDSDAVNEATVVWRRKDGAWQNTPMTSRSNQLYEAQIGAESSPADTFDYQITASDTTGRTSQTDPAFFFLRYPLADTNLFHDLALVALPTQTVASASLKLLNIGNADLNWSLRFSHTDTIRDTELRCWDRTSLGQPWEASTNRSFSPPYALHAGLLSAGGNLPVRATITLPPLVLGTNAVLAFKYWIHSEVYKTTTRAFDGGIVEFSTDGGSTFQQLNGPYTHTIYGWDASPWTNGTPCFAGSGTNGWQTATFDLLKEYPDQLGFWYQPVIFRFHYGGDDNTDNEGWYIDDIDISPLESAAGFSQTVEPTASFTLAGGDYRRIVCHNHPAAFTDTRDAMTTVSVLSNDPLAPAFSFLWTFKIREPPALPELAACQTTDGDGLVALTTGVFDPDREPVSLSVDWSSDRGRTWQPAALDALTADTGTLATHAPDGLVTNIATADGLTPVTNRLAAFWATRDVTPALSVCTQTLFAVTASNAYYQTRRTVGPFTVDNVPPAFPIGTVITASPCSTVGAYALTDNLLTLTWPAASDVPATNLTYTLAGSSDAPGYPALTTRLTQASSTLSLSNGLNATHAFTVKAIDPGGNASDALTLPLLVLDPAGDFDGDGLSNAAEEIAGTFANDTASRFAINPFQPNDPANMGLAWDSVIGRLYTVEASPSLASPDWQPLPELIDIPGTGAPITVALPTLQPTQFFRLKVRRP